MFMEQWVVLGFLLLFMKKTLKRSSSKGRIIVSAAAGSFFGCIILLFLPEINIGKIFLVIFAASITVKLAFQLSGKKLVYFTGYFVTAAAILGGVWTAIQAQDGGWIWGLEFFFSTGTFILMYKVIWHKLSAQKDFLYEVRFQWRQECFCVCGFLDTGNFLYEPLSKMPVSVMEEAVFLKHFHEPLTKMIEKHNAGDIRMIPYFCVGTESGIMPGILVKNIQIINGSQRIKIKKGIVGISKEDLSKSGHYQLLLHPDLIKCGRL